MFYEIFLSLMGNWFRTAITWLGEHPTLTTLVLGSWMLTVFAGQAQLKRLERRTKDFVVTSVKAALHTNPNLSAKQLYKQLYPEWAELVRTSAWFIPHRLEIWPQSATPENVKEKMDFTPEWLKVESEKQGVKFGSSQQ